MAELWNAWKQDGKNGIGKVLEERQRERKEAERASTENNQANE
jgi:hypothetical protein